MLEANSSFAVSAGKPWWVWALVAAAVLTALYIIYTYFFTKPPPPQPVT